MLGKRCWKEFDNLSFKTEFKDSKNIKSRRPTKFYSPTKQVL